MDIIHDFHEFYAQTLNEWVVIFITVSQEVFCNDYNLAVR